MRTTEKQPPSQTPMQGPQFHRLQVIFHLRLRTCVAPDRLSPILLSRKCFRSHLGPTKTQGLRVSFPNGRSRRAYHCQGEQAPTRYCPSLRKALRVARVGFDLIPHRSVRTGTQILLLGVSADGDLQHHPSRAMSSLHLVELVVVAAAIVSMASSWTGPVSTKLCRRCPDKDSIPKIHESCHHLSSGHEFNARFEGNIFDTSQRERFHKVKSCLERQYPFFCMT